MPPHIEHKEFLTVGEFCDRYSVSRATLYRTIFARRDIVPIHIGRSVRIRREDAEAWAASLGRRD